ncbi:MAG: hypothetical protein WBA16_11655 [Nonlabens sp.]
MPRYFHIKSYLLILLSLFFASCGSDDDVNTINEPITDFNYMPLTAGSNWEYDVATGNDRDTEEMTVTQGNASNASLAANTSSPDAFMITVLTAGTLRRVDGRLLGNGNVTFDFQGLSDLNLDIQNGALYDQNAPNGTVLFNVANAEPQVIDGFNVQVSYGVSTVQLEDLATLTVNGESYDNVIHTQLLVSAAVTTVVTASGVATVVDIMVPQNILTIDNYWAENVGLISSSNRFKYQLEDLGAFGVDLSIPQAVDITTTQDLAQFTIN